MRSLVLLSLVLTLVLGSAAATQMSGTYTLDPKKPATKLNFQSLSAVFVALNLSGVSGPVTILIAPGNYTAQIQLRPILGASGKSTITFQANNGLVSITPPTWLQGSVVTNLKDAAWFRLVGMSFTGFITRGIHLDEAKNISLINCTIDDGFHSLPSIYSVYLDDSHGITLQNCSIRSGGTPLYFVGDNTQCLVVGCDIDGKGQATRVVGVNRGGSPYDYNNLLEANYIHDCGPAGAGIYFYESSQGNLIVNNTVVVSTTGSAIEVGYNQQGNQSWATANILRNNIFVNYGAGSAAHYDVFTGTRRISQIDADYNCFHAPNSKRPLLVGRINYPVFAGTLAQFQSALTQPGVIMEPGGPGKIDTNSIEADPRFARATRPYDVHLQSTSPALDRGTTRLVPSYATFPTWPVGPDYEGQQRDPNPDIGADEEYVEIQGTSTVKVGGSTLATLYAANDASLVYRAATSLGQGPLPIGFRRIELTLDTILLASIQGTLPGTFKRYAGFLDSGGRGTLTLVIPNIAALKGTTLHTAFMTFATGAPSGIQSISPTWSVLIN